MYDEKCNFEAAALDSAAMDVAPSKKALKKAAKAAHRAARKAAERAARPIVALPTKALPTPVPSPMNTESLDAILK